MWPGHHTIAGSLIPPSNVVCFPHRKGPLLPPGEGELSPVSGLSLFSRATHALLGTCPCLTPFQLSKVMLLKHHGTKAMRTSLNMALTQETIVDALVVTQCP